MLFDDGGDDDGGVIRTEVLRRTAVKTVTTRGQDHYHRGRPAGPVLPGPRLVVLQADHPERAERACPTVRTRCANMDPVGRTVYDTLLFACTANTSGLMSQPSGVRLWRASIDGNATATWRSGSAAG